MILFYKSTVIFIFLIALPCSLKSQIGIQLNSPSSSTGYNLFAPMGTDTTYIIDNCGKVINKWVSSYRPSLSAYFTEDGHLWRTAKANPIFNMSGAGGKIEKFDWQGNLVWQFDFCDSNRCQHHDIEVLPNGNVLILAVEKKSASECIAIGKDPSKIPASNELWFEMLVEIEPIGINSGNMVWEWHVWDHLVQDFDSTKLNYAPVDIHPELLDINLNVNQIKEDWLHMNAVSYNEELDQILLSSKVTSEIYIIDHSTTTLESASHSGGSQNKGGDLLYRWGNPLRYKRGNLQDRKLFDQHDPEWIPSGYPNQGMISVFNNGNPQRPFSSADIIDPPVDSNGAYIISNNLPFEPNSLHWSYKDSANFYSDKLSSTQVLPNGNVLICNGQRGQFFEVDSLKNKVWEYFSPVSNNGIIPHPNSTLVPSNVFRVYRLEESFAGFDNLNLTPGSSIEPNPNQCTLITRSNDIEPLSLSLYPNPAHKIIYIKSDKSIENIELTDLLGRLIIKKEMKGTKNAELNIQHLNEGNYLIRINRNQLRMIHIF